MIPKQPPKKTPTRPGLGTNDGLPRLDSAELQKVRLNETQGGKESEKDTSFTPPPASRAARVPREDEDENGPVSAPRSDQFIASRTPAQPFKPMGSNPRPQAQPMPRTPAQPFKPMGPPTGQPFKPMGPSTGQPFKPTGMPTSPSFKPTGTPVAQKSSRTTGAWSEEAGTGQRTRKAVTVDSVGDAATRIARTTRQVSPKVIATSATIASAPLDSRTAFILSLVDGTSDVPAIVDAAGMPSDEVIGILARLARLGLISVP